MDGIAFIIIACLFFFRAVIKEQEKIKAEEELITKEEKTVFINPRFAREKKLEEIVSAYPTERSYILDQFCRIYFIEREELLHLLKRLAEEKIPVGEVYHNIFSRLKGEKYINEKERQALFDLYVQYLVGDDLDPIVQLFVENEKHHLAHK